MPPHRVKFAAMSKPIDWIQLREAPDWIPNFRGDVMLRTDMLSTEELIAFARQEAEPPADKDVISDDSLVKRLVARGFRFICQD